MSEEQASNGDAMGTLGERMVLLRCVGTMPRVCSVTLVLMCCFYVARRMFSRRGKKRLRVCLCCFAVQLLCLFLPLCFAAAAASLQRHSLSSFRGPQFRVCVCVKRHLWYRCPAHPTPARRTAIDNPLQPLSFPLLVCSLPCALPRIYLSPLPPASVIGPSFRMQDAPLLPLIPLHWERCASMTDAPATGVCLSLCK